MERSRFKKIIAVLLVLYAFGPLQGYAMTNCRAETIKAPAALAMVRGFVAPDDSAALPKGYWRRYSIELGAACHGGYTPLVEKIHDLATTPKLIDVTDAAAERSVFAKQFMARGAGKQVQPNRVMASRHNDGTAAVFVGRIADDAPGAPSSWMLFCRPPASERITYFQTHLGDARPSDLISLSNIICQTSK